MYGASKVNRDTVRCATAQHIHVLEKLLSTGMYAPERDELRKHESRGCANCESVGNWCYSNALDWMYLEMRKRVQSENTGGVWLWASGDIEQDIKDARFSAGMSLWDIESNEALAEVSRHMVVMVFDIPLERMLHSDVYLFHEVLNDRPIIHRGGLIVDNDDHKAFQPHLKKFTDHHENPATTEEERERRKVESWQLLFDETRWADDVLDGVYGTYDSYVHAVTPYLTFEDLVSIHVRDSEGDWSIHASTSGGIRATISRCVHGWKKRLLNWIRTHGRADSTNGPTHYECIHDDTEIQIVDIVPSVRYVQCGSGLHWWEKWLTRLKFTIFPQWDTLTVGERVSHGEEQQPDSTKQNMEAS